jgi:hypothetical protein
MSGAEFVEIDFTNDPPPTECPTCGEMTFIRSGYTRASADGVRWVPMIGCVKRACRDQEKQ